MDMQDQFVQITRASLEGVAIGFRDNAAACFTGAEVADLLDEASKNLEVFIQEALQGVDFNAS